MATINEAGGRGVSAMADVWVVSVFDAGDMLDTVVFTSEAGAKRFHDAMREEGWEVTWLNATPVTEEGVDETIAAWRMDG